MHAEEALRCVLRRPGVKTVLDVGAGAGLHAAEFVRMGFLVTAIDLRRGPEHDIYRIRWATGDFLRLTLVPADVVWCSHVLEHQADVAVALAKLRSFIAPGGCLAITVPPLKHAIVGGHVSLWNLGLLAYRLILAGFDCSRAAAFAAYGYNLSAIVELDQEAPSDVLGSLRRGSGDIETLAPYFPPSWHVRQGFDGEKVPAVNWKEDKKDEQEEDEQEDPNGEVER